MAVVLVPITLPVLTRDEVRLFLRDRADNNVLLDQVQFDNADIGMAINMATSEWNSITPITNVPSEVIPKALLLMGTTSWLMSSESFLQIRNQATYQDGEIGNIGLDDKFGQYAQIASSLRAEWQMMVKSYKIQENMESGYGSLGSGYRWTPRVN